MTLTDEEIKTLKNIFDEQTEKTGGTLDEENLTQLLSNFDIDQSFAKPMLRIMSVSNEDGKVKFDSFLSFLQMLLSQDFEIFFKKLFHAIDVNGDGKLMAPDLVEFCNLIGDTITQEDAEQIILDCDLDESGSIEFEDFWQWFSRKQ